jgi:hypothetical protein
LRELDLDGQTPPERRGPSLARNAG